MEPTKVKITIYRHAQAEHNIEPYDVGIFDPLLTAKGLEQSLQTYLNRKDDRVPDIVISSVARRALQTAHRIYPDTTIFGTQLLAEYNTLVNCNKLSSETEIKTMFPYLRLDYYSSEELPPEFSWDDGSKRAMYIKNLVYGLASTRKYKDIVLVSHANFIYSLLSVFQQDKLPGELPNCEKVSFEILV